MSATNPRGGQKFGFLGVPFVGVANSSASTLGLKFGFLGSPEEAIFPSLVASEQTLSGSIDISAAFDVAAVFVRSAVAQIDVSAALPVSVDSIRLIGGTAEITASLLTSYEKAFDSNLDVSASLAGVANIVRRRRRGGGVKEEDLERIIRQQTREWEEDRKREADKRRRLDDLLGNAVREVFGETETEEDETPDRAETAAVIERVPFEKAKAVLSESLRANSLPKVTLRVSSPPKVRTSDDVWPKIARAAAKAEAGAKAVWPKIAQAAAKAEAKAVWPKIARAVAKAEAKARRNAERSRIRWGISDDLTARH